MGASSVREAERIRRKTLQEVLQAIKEAQDRLIALCGQVGGVKKQGLSHEISAYAKIIKMLEAMLQGGNDENY